MATTGRAGSCWCTAAQRLIRAILDSACESAEPRILEQVTFTAVKVQHLEDYVVDVDMDRYTEDIALLKRTARD